MDRMRLRLALALVVASAFAGCTREAPVGEPVRAVRTVEVQAHSSRAVQEFAAEVRARTESRLGFRVGGKLVRRQVDLGSRVRRGDLLAQLDAGDLRLGHDAARAALQAAEVAVDQNAADVDRFRGLQRQGFISAAELERRESALRSSRAQWEQARAQLALQSNQAAYAELRADADGVITAVEAEPGAVVAAGTPVLRLAHDGARDVVFSMPEDRVDAVRGLLGRSGGVRVRLWSDPRAQPLPATVREIAASADAAMRTFQVKADVGRAALKLGQTATVLIEEAEAPAGVRLPLAAVFEAGGRPAVWLVEAAAMTVRQQPVEIVGTTGSEVVVGGGLQPGQRVVSAGVHMLTPGQKVAFYVEPARPDGSAPASAQREAAR